MVAAPWSVPSKCLLGAVIVLPVALFATGLADDQGHPSDRAWYHYVLGIVWALALVGFLISWLRDSSRDEWVNVSQRWFWVAVVLYLGLVAVTAVATGPTVIRGADGLEIMALGLLGLPWSLLGMAVGAWGMWPFGDTASDWGTLVGLVAGSLINVAIPYDFMVQKARRTRIQRSSIDL